MEISSQEKLLLALARTLEALKINYFITGGFAVSVWGRPRATFDIDIVVEVVESQAKLLVKAWKSMARAGYADEQMVKEAIKNGGEFNFIDPDSGIKVDFWVVPKDSRELKNKKTGKINGQKIYFISPEDLIISKLRWYNVSPSSRHLEDIESILKISGKKLDKKYLKNWIARLGLQKIVSAVRF